MVRIEAIRLRLRENLWLLPLLAAVVAAGSAYVVGSTHPLEHGSRFDGILFSGDAGSAQSVLSTVLAAVVTALSVVSSLTLVALQTASTQFSPRLLRNFVRDLRTQAVLAGFVFTSSFLIVLLVDVGSGDDVPRLGISLGLFMVLASVVMIAYFFHHVSQSIRVEGIMATVVRESLRAGQRLRRWMDDVSIEPADLPPPPQDARVVVAPNSGYLQEVDVDNLWDFANRHRLVLRLVPQLGQAVTAGSPLFWCWSNEGAEVEKFDDEVLVDSVGLGYERTLRRDVALGMRQLVDMAIKAMSPAVNDPYTAMQGIDHLGEILSVLAQHRLGDRVRYDDDGNLRLAVPAPTFGELAALACDQIRRYGSREPAVALRQLSMLRSVGARADEEGRACLRRHAALIAEDALNAVENQADRSELDIAAVETLAWFDDGSIPERSARGGF